MPWFDPTLLDPPAALLAVGLAVGLVWLAVRRLWRQPRRAVARAVSDGQLAQLAEHTAHLVVFTDRDHRLLWANPAFTRHSGYELHEVIGRCPDELLCTRSADPQQLQRLRAELAQGRGARAELLHRSRDGREFWVDAEWQPRHDAAGTLLGFATVQVELSEPVRARQRAAALLAALPVAVVLRDADGRVRDLNPAAAALLGVAPGDDAAALLQRSPVDRALRTLSADDLPTMRRLRGACGDEPQVVGLDDGDGARRWLRVDTRCLADALGQPDGVLECWRPDEAAAPSADGPALAAGPDGSGPVLEGRQALLAAVQHAIDRLRAQPEQGFALLFIDIDHMAAVNDSVGRDAGDGLLQQLAARLQATLRPGDRLARVASKERAPARLGGDEFVLLLHGLCEHEQAAAAADALLQDIAEPLQLQGRAVQLTASVGVRLADPSSQDADALLRDADIAMVEAKRGGRARWEGFDPAMRERAQQVRQIATGLRAALAADALPLVFRPVLDLAERQLVAVQALPAWPQAQHAQPGPVDADVVFAAVEDCGLADRLAERLLQQACSCFARWQLRWGAQAPQTLMLRLPAAQWRQAGLAAEVCAALDAQGLEPKQLQLEVAAQVAARDAQARVTLQALHGAGVRLALAGLGSGRATLASLQQLPVDLVCIDRSFVAQAHALEHHRVLVSATIGLAHSLGMGTLAEGLERDEQLQLMQSLGCERGQGPLLGAALPPDAFEQLIEREARDTVA